MTTTVLRPRWIGVAGVQLLIVIAAASLGTPSDSRAATSQIVPLAAARYTQECVSGTNPASGQQDLDELRSKLADAEDARARDQVDVQDWIAIRDEDNATIAEYTTAENAEDIIIGVAKQKMDTAAMAVQEETSDNKLLQDILGKELDIVRESMGPTEQQIHTQTPVALSAIERMTKVGEKVATIAHVMEISKELAVPAGSLLAAVGALFYDSLHMEELFPKFWKASQELRDVQNQLDDSRAKLNTDAGTVKELEAEIAAAEGSPQTGACGAPTPSAAVETPSLPTASPVTPPPAATPCVIQEGPNAGLPCLTG